MRPAMDRKIFSAFAPAKHSQKANMNESFKKGLRNALTGLYVSPPVTRNEADELRGTSNSFGVPYERRPEDTVPSEDEIVDYGEETWEVSSRLRKRRAFQADC